MDGSILEFVRSVKIESCRVCNTPNFIFLCGGATSDGKASAYRSARDYFYRYLRSTEPGLAKRFRLAEEINDWFDKDTFEDLLELEVCLADLCDLTILFVESPGSIAELGAFAASEHLRPKTLAILNSAHPSARTFIADGPVRRIWRNNEQMIRYYEWDKDDPTHPASIEAFEDMSKELIQFVQERARALPKEAILDRSDGNTMLLIADLVNIIGITTASEVTECLEAWGHVTSRKTLQKYLVLLDRLALIKQKPYSSQVYYLSRPGPALVRFDFHPGSKARDRERIKTLIRSALGKNDPRRMKVFEREQRASSHTRGHRV